MFVTNVTFPDPANCSSGRSVLICLVYWLAQEPDESICQAATSDLRAARARLDTIGAAAPRAAAAPGDGLLAFDVADDLVGGPSVDGDGNALRVVRRERAGGPRAERRVKGVGVRARETTEEQDGAYCTF